MLTLGHLLETPIFATAKVITGHQSLHRVVRRAHVVDLPDATYDWAKGGELLLTSGNSLRNSNTRQKELIPQLVQKNLAGMIFSTGKYFEETPHTVRTAAEAHRFPIIELPASVPFIDVTESIYTHLLNQQVELRERAADIHRKLTEIVLDDGTLQDVAERLAAILGLSITIESESFEVWATAQVGPVDEARTRSIKAGRTTPDVAAHLLQRDIYDRLLATHKPQHVPAMPELGMTIERIVAPIIVARRIIGYVWIIAGPRDLTELDELAIENAAMVTALLKYKERAVHEMEVSLRGDFLSQLLTSGGVFSASIVERAHQLSFRLEGYYQVLVVMGYAPAADGPTFLSSRIEGLLHDMYPALVVPREANRIVVVLQGARIPDTDAITDRLSEVLNHPAEQILIGVGGVVSHLKALNTSYRQATEALEVALGLRQREGVVFFRQLGILHWLRHLPPEVIAENPYLEIIESLARYDQDHQSDLLITLETYLDTGNGSADTAAKLSVHRNTLAYRLERIEEITHVSLRDANSRLNLHVALKNYRLNH